MEPLSGRIPRDQNRVPVLAAVSSVDGVSTVTLEADPATGRLLVNSTGGTSASSAAINDGVTTSILATVAHLTNSNPLAVEIVDGSGNQITSFGGGTQYANGAVQATPTGTVALGWDTANVRALSTDTSGKLNINTIAGTVTVSGTVTANAGTNLNTSLLALESGGNLASIKADADNLNLAQGSTTSGQKGNLVLGAVTTAAPTYSTTQSSPLSLTTAGALRVDGSAVTQPVSLTSTTITGTVAVTESGTWNVGASSATGSAVPANAFYIGANDISSGNLVGLRVLTNSFNSGSGALAAGVTAVFDDVTPTTITENQFGAVRMSANRNLYQTIRDAAGNERGLNITSRNSALIEGVTASGSSIASSPVTTGGQAKTANPTAVTDGQVVNATYDKLGKQIVVGSVRDLKANQVTTITASVSETTIVTAVASTFLDMYGLIITNTSATAVNVAIKDATAGTTRLNIAVPAGDTRGFMLPEGGAIKQTAVNNNWTATSSASVTSLIITALTVQNL